MKLVCIYCNKEFNQEWFIPRLVCSICDCKYNKEEDGGNHVGCPHCYKGGINYNE
jgi:hypothetical protein